MVAMAEERMMTVAEVAAYLRVSEPSVRRWLREGRLRGIQVAGEGGKHRIPEDEVRRLYRATASKQRE